jgi:membrane protease YdiL (CAAX protease family)
MAGCLLAWLILFGGLVMPVIRDVGEAGSFAGDAARLGGAVISAGFAMLIYRLLVGKVERRQVFELSSDPGMRLGLAGLAFGLTLFCSVIALIWLAGAAQFIGAGNGTRLAAALAAAMMAAIGEELLFRGVMFRIVEQATGTLAALLVSALVFGLAHLASANSTIVTALAIAIEAGLLLGLAYVATRNLWFPIGIHFAWNFTQAGIFGITSSGPSANGLVKLQFDGPEWLTGWVFGPEESLVAVALCFAAAAGLAVVARRRGEWQPTRFRLSLD